MIRIEQTVERFVERLGTPANNISECDSWKELVPVVHNIETELCRLREAVTNHAFIDREGWQETVLTMDQELLLAKSLEEIPELGRAMEEAQELILETNLAHTINES